MTFSNTVYADNASGSTNMSLNTSSVVLGNQVTMTITLKCDDGVGGALITLGYDSAYLTLAQENLNGKATLSGRRIVVEPTYDTTVSFSLVFTSVKIGNTSLSVNISDFISMDAEYVGSYSQNISKNLEIKAKSTDSTPTNPSTPIVNLSNDASLFSLKVKGMVFEEIFSSSKYDYTIYCDEKIDKLDIEAVCNSSKASYTIENNSLSEGWNEVKVVCTAENKTKKEYIIRVYIEETPKVYFDKLGAVVNLDKVDCPEGFEKVTEIIENNELTIFTHGNLNLIYLVNENGSKDFYVFDKESNKILCKYEPFEINGHNYLKVDFNYDDFKELNNDFNVSKYKINDDIILNCWGYKAENMTDYRLFYLMNDEGECELYSYEITGKTLQKYTLPINETNPTTSEVNLKDIILYSVTAASLICFVTSIILVGSVKNL